MADETLQLWKYTVGRGAEAWVSDFGYLTTVASLVPSVEAALGVTISGAATDAEVKSAPPSFSFSPGMLPRQRRAYFGGKDAQYRALMLQANAMADKAAAEALRLAADARADALFATDRAAKVRARG